MKLDLSNIPEMKAAQTDCPHREQARVPLEALYPVSNVIIAGAADTVWFPKPLVKCGDCGAILPGFEPPSGLMIQPNGAQSQAAGAQPAQKLGTRFYCACGKPLTQPYAIQMGECVECCLHRIRHGRDQKTFLTAKKIRKQKAERRQRALAMQAG